MNSSRWRITVGSSALLASVALSGCMAQRPHPYNRRSFHASLDQEAATNVSRAQLARWSRASEQQLASTTANSSKELTVDKFR